MLQHGHNSALHVSCFHFYSFQKTEIDRDQKKSVDSRMRNIQSVLHKNLQANQSFLVRLCYKHTKTK